jgi:hypothetical protein
MNGFCLWLLIVAMRIIVVFDVKGEIMKLQKSILGFLLGFLFVSLSPFALTAVAETPDGQTPAEESVCDVLQSGTPGLYGLCIAYCEAQDLNDYNFDELENSKKAAPHRKILENYRKKMQPGDMDMPCLATQCPCWEEAELLNVDQSNINASESCSSVPPPQYVIQTSDPIVPLEGGFAAILAIPPGTVGACGTRDINPGIFLITAEEAQACADQIAARCNEVGYPLP